MTKNEKNAAEPAKLPPTPEWAMTVLTIARPAAQRATGLEHDENGVMCRGHQSTLEWDYVPLEDAEITDDEPMEHVMIHMNMPGNDDENPDVQDDLFVTVTENGAEIAINAQAGTPLFRQVVESVPDATEPFKAADNAETKRRVEKIPLERVSRLITDLVEAFARLPK
jgi:hypothetical protein